MLDGERQVAPDLSGIRLDHRARYRWAARNLPRGSRIIDLACGVGYGAAIMADAGHRVLAVDKEQEAIAYGREHYASPKIAYLVGAAGKFMPGRDAFDAATCFETIEHLEDPRPMLRGLAQGAPTLFASVPNEEMFPFRNYRFHFRHYTRRQFYELLLECGWEVTEWWGQHGPGSEVERGVNGRTAIVIAKRVKAKAKRNSRKTRAAVDVPEVIDSTIGQHMFDQFASDQESLVEQLGGPVQAAPAPKIPERVAICGLGPTLDTFVSAVKCLGARSKLCDEVWGINSLGDVLKCDLVFHMDDVRIQESRAAAAPDGNIAAMLTWMKTYEGPIFTSRAHPDYPGLIEFPLADVLNSCGSHRYFNSTAAYAVAYAIHIGVKNIQCYGMDFSYADSHRAEKGRGCVEFWLGMASARGIKVSIAKSSTLMDACVPNNERLYGYDTVTVEITGEAGNETVSFMEREQIPTAEEIEHRYDHHRHTSRIVEEANKASGAAEGDDLQVIVSAVADAMSAGRFDGPLLARLGTQAQPRGR